MKKQIKGIFLEIGCVLKAMGDAVMSIVWMSLVFLLVGEKVGAKYDIKVLALLFGTGTYLVSLFKARKDTGLDAMGGG